MNEEKRSTILDVLSGRSALKTQVQLAFSPEIVFTVVIVLIFILYIKFYKK